MQAGITGIKCICFKILWKARVYLNDFMDLFREKLYQEPEEKFDYDRLEIRINERIMKNVLTQ